MHTHEEEVREQSAPPELEELLRDRRDEIVSYFVANVHRTDLPPPDIAPPLLINHIPRFLDEIAIELSRLKAARVTHDVIDTSSIAREHGEQRWALGYNLEALIREYGVLRQCILQLAQEAGVRMSIDEFNVLAKCLSVGVVEAATEYTRYRDEQVDSQKAHLEFLAEAGELLSASLDYHSTLRRLTALLVPRMADWCAIHLEGGDLEEMQIAHIDPQKADVIRDLFRRYPPSADSQFGYPHVARTGEPQLMPDVDPPMLERIAVDDEHLALLREIDTCSWIVVPLRIQGNMFGAMTIAQSRSKRHYDSSDLVLASEIARRAAVAIDNARLYALSQKERSRVEAATRAKDEFVAMVSHELRTPLNAILGWLRLMRNGSLSPEKREHAFQVIERNAEAQSQLVSDLLDISRVITGKIRINPAQLNLGDVLDMAIEGIRPAAEAKRIEIDTSEIDRASATMRGDVDRLQQVAWNLLANAVKFTPKAGTVRVKLRRFESDLELVVQDSGEGIEASFLPHVFESFRQSEGGSARVHGGLGIGLSIVKHIVELHGGSIEARSEGRAKGATFIVRIPISPLVSTTVGVPRVPVATITAPQSSPLLPHNLEGIRVLVVDDEADARELLLHLLASLGMEVREAGSAADALAELTQYAPHVIISDIGMPDEDGYFFVRAIRTHIDEAKRNIPVIALTAFASNADRTRALVEGFNLHMAKPVEPTELIRAVADLCGRK